MSSFDIENALTRSSDEEDAYHRTHRAYSDDRQQSGSPLDSDGGAQQQQHTPHSPDPNRDAHETGSAAQQRLGARPGDASDDPAGGSSAHAHSQSASGTPHLSLEQRLRRAQGGHPAPRPDGTAGVTLISWATSHRHALTGAARTVARQQRHVVLYT